MSSRLVLDESFIDRIYEAALIPELWPDVLQRLTDISGADGTSLLTADASNIRWTSTAGLRPHVEAWLAEGWHLRNTRMPRLLAQHYSGFLRDIDLFTAEEIDANQEICEFFRPRGYGYAAGTAIPIPTGDMLVFSIERNFKKGPIEAQAIGYLNGLRPHLARAALLSGRLLLARARAVAVALDTIGLPAAVLRAPARLLAVNSGFDKLVPHIFQDGRDRVRLTEQRADRLLDAALSELKTSSNDAVCSIPIAASEERPPIIIHVVPLRGLGRDVFDRGIAVVMATPVVTKDVPAAEVLQALFVLTPAEARVARAVGGGQTIDASAQTFGVSSETVRSQVKSVLAKTGLGRQAELAALLGGLVLPQS